MSVVHRSEMTEKDLAAHRANASKSRGPVTPHGKTNSAAANLRHGFYSEQEDDVMVRLGENPQHYRALMESLIDDLQPRPGLKSQLVLRMGRALWRMQRADRMRDGQSLKRIDEKVRVEEILATTAASCAVDAAEPYELLSEALARRRGPTADEIDAFVASCGDSSDKLKSELVDLLQSLKPPMEERERKQTLRRARKQLKPLVEGYVASAQCFASAAHRVQAPENLAALAAPHDDKSVLLQRMEDSNMRQLWRLTNTLMRIRNGGLTQKDVKNEDRSGYVHENKREAEEMASN